MEKSSKYNWLLRNEEKGMIKYILIKNPNIHKVFKRIGLSYDVFKLDYVEMPTDNNPIFHWVGRKCDLKYQWSFIHDVFWNNVKFDSCDNDSYTRNAKRMLEALNKYEHRDMIATIKTTEKKKLFSRKPYTRYEIDFDGTIILPTAEKADEYCSNFVIDIED